MFSAAGGVLGAPKERSEGARVGSSKESGAGGQRVMERCLLALGERVWGSCEECLGRVGFCAHANCCSIALIWLETL